ncbi:MAG: hypothetical protein K0S38_425 [Candidatus Paceibacter sp.]|jgi:hypothetical protein|nr:hypothetical protein [Candidatus Paceibacter sp.]
MPSIEVNPALILREADEARQGLRKAEECIPENIQAGQSYPFLKKGLRIYWFDGEIPLIVKNSEGRLSRPIASIAILEVTHFVDNGNIFTRGLYKVTEIFGDQEIHFEGLEKVDGSKGSWFKKFM